MADTNSLTVGPGFLALMFDDEIPLTLPLDETGSAKVEDLNCEIHRLWQQAIADCQE